MAHRLVLERIDSTQEDEYDPNTVSLSFWEDVGIHPPGSPSSTKTPRVSSGSGYPNSVSPRNSMSSIMGSPQREFSSTTSLERRLIDAPESKQGLDILNSSDRNRRKSADGDLFTSFKKELQDENVFLRTQVARAQNLLHAAGVTGQRYVEENNKLRRKIATEIRTDEATMDRLQERIDELEAINKTLGTELSEKKKQAQGLEHEIGVLKHDMGIGRLEWEDRTSNYVREIEHLTTEISQVRSDSEHIKNTFNLKIERLQNEVDSFSTRNNLLSSDNEKLVSDTQRLAQDLQFSQHRNKMLKREIAETGNVLMGANRRSSQGHGGPPKRPVLINSSSYDRGMGDKNDREPVFSTPPGRPRFRSAIMSKSATPASPPPFSRGAASSINIAVPTFTRSKDGSRRASTSELAGNAADFMRGQQDTIARMQEDVDDLKALNETYDDRFHDILKIVDELITTNEKVDRQRLREVSEMIRRQVDMEEIIAPPVGMTPPPPPSSVDNVRIQQESMTPIELDFDEESKIEETESRGWITREKFLDMSRLESYKNVVMEFLQIYSREDTWKYSNTENEVNVYELTLSLNQSIRARHDANRTDESDKRTIKVRMSFLYPLTVLLGQTIGVERKCIAYAFVLLLWPRESQISWLASVFGEMERTLKHHDDPKLWTFVYGVLQYVFVCYDYVMPFVGTQTVLEA